MRFVDSFRSIQPSQRDSDFTYHAFTGKHKKPSQRNPKGERVQLEMPIHRSNVMHVDAATGKATRRAPARTEKNQGR